MQTLRTFLGIGAVVTGGEGGTMTMVCSEGAPCFLAWRGDGGGTTEDLAGDFAGARVLLFFEFIKRVVTERLIL